MKIKNYLTFIGESNSEIILEYYCFDWDDNLLSMPTKINMEHKVGEEWILNPVSTEHFAEIRSDLENWRPVKNAYVEFGDFGPRGRNAFLDDIKSSMGGAVYPQKPLKAAPSWDKFIQCLESGSVFSIITARAHSDEVLRSGVEWVIDNYLSWEQKKNMYNNCLSFNYIFKTPGQYEPSNEDMSKHPLISAWLDQCGFYGVSNPDFVAIHKSGGAEKPEIGKEIAFKEFVKRVSDFANKLGVRFKLGVSDDDLKNVLHYKTVLSELKDLYPEAEFTVIDTSKGGYERTDIISNQKIGEATDSIQAPGMASSIMSFSSFNNQGSRLFPSNVGDNDPVAHTHRMATDYISKQSKEWTKGFKKSLTSRKKKTRMKK